MDKPLFGGRQDVFRWLALALAGVAGLLTVILLGRAAAGALTRVPGTPVILTLAAAGFGLTWGAWRLHDAANAGDPLQSRAARGLWAILLGTLLGLLPAQDSSSGLACVATLALLSTVAVALRLARGIDGTSAVRQWSSSGPARDFSVFGRTTSHEHQVASAGEAPDTGGEVCDSIGPSASPGADRVDAESPGMIAADFEGLDDPQLQMRMERRRTANEEQIEAQVRVHFAAGAREAALHLPIWPALCALPEVECEPLDSAEVDVRITAVERYGIRLEARLASPAPAEMCVLLGIEISAACEHATAAAA